MAKKIRNFVIKGAFFALFLLFLPSFGFATGPGSISIIIDDMGYDHYVMSKFLEINMPIAFSFIPDTPYAYMSNNFCKKGYTVMLHMPSESVNKHLNDYKLLLKVSDSDNEITEKIEKALAKVPCASGFNNHMGSKFLQNADKVYDMMKFLKQHNLFFVDSLTTPHSVGAFIACKLGVRYATRDMFIDNKKRLKYVENHLLVAISLAKEGKNVIVIGHDNIVTLEAILHLKNQLKPYLKDIKENLKQCQQ